MPTRNLSIRLSVRDEDVVRRALQGLGKEGEKALNRIERASRPASKSLLALNAVSRDIQGSFAGFAGRLGPLGSALGSIGPAGLAAAGGLTAVIAAGAGLTKMALDAARVADNFQKMALRTTLSTESLSELAHAAELSGTSIGALEPSLVRLQRRMVAAQGANNLYARGFEYLGIVTEDAEGNLRSAEEVFLDIADAVEAAGASTETVNAVTRVLGQTASSLIPLLQQGSEGIRDMMREARALGLSITQEQADRAAHMNDEISRLAAAWRGLKQDIGLGLIDPLTDAIQQMQDLVAWIKRVSDAHIRGGIRIREFFGIGLSEQQEAFLERERQAQEREARAALPRAARIPHVGQIEGITVTAQKGFEELIETLDAMPEPVDVMKEKFGEFLTQMGLDIDMMDRRNQAAAAQMSDEEDRIRAQMMLQHEQERARLRGLGIEEKQLRQLEDLQAAELALAIARNRSQKETEEATEADIKDMMAQIRAQQIMHSNILGLIDVLGRFNDRMAQMANDLYNVAQAVPQGPLATAIAGFTFLYNVFNDGRRTVDAYTDQMRRLNEAMIEAARAAQNTIESVLAESPEFRAAQEAVLAPLRTFFFQFQMATPNLRSFEQIREFLKLFSEAGRFSIREILDPTGTGSGFPPFAQLPQDFVRLLGDYLQFQDPFDFFRELEAVFGPEELFGDIIRESFRLENAFNSLTETVIDTTAAEERAVRARFDLEEMGLRQAARRQYILAGGDPFLQAGVFRGLSRQITQLAGAERAALSAIGRTGGIALPGGGGGGVGGPTGGTGTGFGALQPIPVDSWDDIFNIEAADPITPEHWSEVIDVSMLWNPEMAITEFAWPDVIKIGAKYGVDDQRPRWWGDVIQPGALWRMPAITEFAWPDVIKIGSKYGVDGYRPYTWGDVVAFSAVMDLEPFYLPWSRAIVLQPIRIESWSQVFEEQPKSGFGHPGGGTTIFPPPVTVQASELVRIVGRIPIRSLVDLSELDARIDGRITRSQQDRSQTEEEKIRGLYDLVGKRTG